jgi:hypothetical protein
MLTEIDILRDISGRLDALSLPYMLTGSMAMNYYAVPRMTRDIDMVINLLSSSCDIEYLRRWALQLDVSSELNTLPP